MERVTSKKIYSKRPDIEKVIMDKYPLSKDEKKGCHTAKAIRDHMRFELAKKIYAGELSIEDVQKQRIIN
jgi:hypothetical protein